MRGQGGGVIRVQRRGNTEGLFLELIEERIELDSIEDKAGALMDRGQARAPERIESSPLDPGVGHSFTIVKAALHSRLRLFLPSPMGSAVPMPGMLIWWWCRGMRRAVKACGADLCSAEASNSWCTSEYDLKAAVRYAEHGHVI